MKNPLFAVRHIAGFQCIMSHLETYTAPFSTLLLLYWIYAFATACKDRHINWNNSKENAV